MQKFMALHSERCKLQIARIQVTVPLWKKLDLTACSFSPFGVRVNFLMNYPFSDGVRQFYSGLSSRERARYRAG